MLSSFQRHWGIDQWVEYLKDKEIPVLPSTKEIMGALRAQDERTRESMSPRELTTFVYADPYLSLKLLRNAERRRSNRLGKETTTALAAILQTGSDELLELVANCPTIEEDHSGWHACASRAAMGSSIAHAWASMHADISPDEVALAALLSECGELLLWIFARELPISALEELSSGRSFRTARAQQQVVGFTFKQLTLSLAQSWGLPNLITMLIKGTDTPRATIARLAIDTARHIVTDYHNPALPSDLVNIGYVLPHAGHEKLISVLPLTDDHKRSILDTIAQQDDKITSKDTP